MKKLENFSFTLFRFVKCISDLKIPTVFLHCAIILIYNSYKHIDSYLIKHIIIFISEVASGFPSNSLNRIIARSILDGQIDVSIFLMLVFPLGDTSLQ